MKAYMLQINMSKKFQPADYKMLGIVEATSKEEAKEKAKAGDFKELFTSTDHHLSHCTIDACRVTVLRHPAF